MKRLDEDRPDLRNVRVVYADLDGTLVGPGGSLFALPVGSSTRAATALGRLVEAGIELVLVSGRTRGGMREPARVLGATGFVAELGAIVVEQLLPEEGVTDFGAFEGRGSPFEAMVRSGAGAFLLDRYPERLEMHLPWAALGREATMLFRGLVDPREATEALREAGYGWLQLHDNGRIRRRSGSLQVDDVHAYHLTPGGVSKGSGVRLHRARRGIPLEAAVLVGDSPSDVAAAPEVAAMFLVANGLAGPEEGPNVRVTSAPAGDGFAEVVDLILT